MAGSPDPAPQAATVWRLNGVTRHYVFIDYLTQGYLALVGGLVLLFHNATMPHWPWLVLAHAGVLLLVHGLVEAAAARPAHRTLAFVRHFYPVLLYTGFYRETGLLNQMFVTGYLDPFFIRLEERLFGVQPSVTLMEAWPYLWLSELFYVAYFSYYMMIAGVGLALYVRERRQFYHYVSIVSFVFYACYLTYICLPVMGPRIFFRDLTDYELPAGLLPADFAPEFPAVVQVGLFYRIMAVIYHVFESPGAAFPSSHVAVALCTVYFSARYLPAIWRVHAVVVVLLCVSTVYCRYHYVVDVAAGAFAAAVLIPLGNRLYAKCARHDASTRPSVG